ncbi:MAG TPA: homoserine kinase [Acidimicrobiales bacterium]|nr:homoserine kinase [Acidimicrobiales bacterium]
MTRVRVPASSANLGPGFDVLAVAVGLHVEVSVEPADRLEVVASGEGSDLPLDREHLAARVACEVAGTDRLRIEVDSAIPVGRGLGSSAALAVAAAAAAGAGDPFSWGVKVDGHPENAAASAFGGLVVATTIGGGAVWRRLALDPGLVFVALVPDKELLTAAARRVLADQVRREDAVFNLGRLGLLIAGLADLRQLLPEAGDDRLHQDARASLFPEAPALLAGLRRAGALTSFWSGAGTTLIGVCAREEGPAVQEAGRELLERHSVKGRVLLVEAAERGITQAGGPGH